MKSWILCMLMLAPLGLVAEESKSGNTVSSNAAIREVHTDQLKSWYDQKKTMIVLDAGSKEYAMGKSLPGSKWICPDTTETEIAGMIPSKDALVVVYCLNPSCPGNHWLARKLQSIGYTNVYVYPEGIEEWARKGYPTATP